MEEQGGSKYNSCLFHYFPACRGKARYRWPPLKHLLEAAKCLSKEVVA
ncbi:hypothetical protein CPter291_1613 [Collimonas pratensis]|uniref:Uncharacterized protein n=1 Tax=Collimonas pratensis TaxID=279113 RepID=A0A127QUT1_9BURK|nr:hypothetical protein CPter91_1556 [Collimonas pratensis]AMP13884.1 hypothetical protein CPter291_1613 [Collimonas pratensis]